MKMRTFKIRWASLSCGVMRILLLIASLLGATNLAARAQQGHQLSPTEEAARIAEITGTKIEVIKETDPIKGEIWIYKLESVKPDVIRELPENQTIQIQGIIGGYGSVKTQYDFTAYDRSRIFVIGDFPVGKGYTSWVLRARVIKKVGGGYMLSEIAKWQPKPAPWWQNRLMMAGLGLIVLALIALIALWASNESKKKQRAAQEAEQLRLQQEEQAKQAQRQQQEAELAAKAAVHYNAETQTGAPKPPDNTIQSVGAVKVLSGPHAAQSFPLVLGENRIGRKKDGQTSILLDRDAEVSGYHGSIIVTHNGAHFKDASSNGSSLDGQIVHHAERPLNSGATLEIGGSTLQITLRHAPASTPASKVAQADTIVNVPTAQAVSTPANNGGHADGTMVGYNAALQVVDGPDKGKPLFVITKKQVTIGRDGADLLLTDPAISGRHATLSVESGRFWIADLGSTNGTKINEVPLGKEAQELTGNERIALGSGKTILQFHRYE